MSAPTSKMRVHVLDDEPANVLLLARVLKAAGYTDVTCSTDSRASVAAIRQDPPDLLLLDLNMPHLDGYGVLRELREQLDPEDLLPVLVVTADVTDAAKRRALAEGATDFLTKPFDHIEVGLRVGNLLRTRALQLRLRERGDVLERELEARREVERLRAAEHEAAVQRIDEVLTGGHLRMVFQPIVDLGSGRTVGAESLARFTAEPRRAPDRWFAEAAQVGLGVELEVAAVLAAYEALPQLPPDTYLSVNLSPATVLCVHPEALLTGVDPGRLVVELTEHAMVEDYPELVAALSVLRRSGVRLAVDDAGSGFASLRHVLQLAPDVIKLDTALTRGVDADPVKRALCTAFASFAREIGAGLVGEGIETEGERDVLHALGVRYGQGYLLGSPGEPHRLPRACAPAARPVLAAPRAANDSAPLLLG